MLIQAHEHDETLCVEEGSRPEERHQSPLPVALHVAPRFAPRPGDACRTQVRHERHAERRGRQRVLLEIEELRDFGDHSGGQRAVREIAIGFPAHDQTVAGEFLYPAL